MININGEDWRVMLTSSNHPALLKPNGYFTLGSCDDEAKTIYLNENLNNKYLKKVLCHELVHACMYSYNIDLNY
jgi:Zn-dependent peptidase ImmA (M78 family)